MNAPHHCARVLDQKSHETESEADAETETAGLAVE